MNVNASFARVIQSYSFSHKKKFISALGTCENFNRKQPKMVSADTTKVHGIKTRLTIFDFGSAGPLSNLGWPFQCRYNGDDTTMATWSARCRNTQNVTHKNGMVDFDGVAFLRLGQNVGEVACRLESIPL